MHLKSIYMFFRLKMKIEPQGILVMTRGGHPANAWG